MPIPQKTYSIAYIAKHLSGGNDDEGAIAYAFRSMGHTILPIHEHLFSPSDIDTVNKCDFVLFHHMTKMKLLREVKVPKAFWYFDLVDYGDPTLRMRCAFRKDWMAEASKVVDIGFMTDGNWARTNPEKFRVLRQGIDIRYAQGPSRDQFLARGLLVAANSRGGRGRDRFFEWMKTNFDDRTVIVNRLHRERLGAAVRKYGVTVAPAEPILSSYWSNRAYIMTGIGALLIHPHADDFEKEFEDKKEVVMYRTMRELYEVSEFFTRGTKEASDIAYSIAMGGYLRTIKDHTYHKRCEKMLEMLTEAKLL